MKRRAHVTALLAAAIPLWVGMAGASEVGPAMRRVGARDAMRAAPGAPARGPADVADATRPRPEGVVSLDAGTLAALARRDADHLNLDGFPLGPGRTADLSLARVDPLRHASLVIASVGDDGIIRESNLSATGSPIWAGRVEGEPDSIAVIARTPDFTYGYVEASFGSAIISSGPVGSGLPAVSFVLQDLPEGAISWADHACTLLVPPAGRHDGGAEGGIAGADPCRQATIAIETDVEFLARFGGNANAAADYVATLFAASNLIYVRDLSLHPNLAYLRLWQGGSDPWQTTSSGDALNEFRSHWETNMRSVSRTLAHMLSGRGLGGGVAWLSSICNSFSYATSGNLAGSFPYPIADNSGQNWDLMVFTHEMGHNLGAPHTHSQSPAADGCGLDPADCSVAQAGQGTIMSYCHLCSGGIANMKMRFHENSVGAMRGFLNATSCDITGPTERPATLPDRVVVSQPVTLDVDVLANDVPFNCESVTIASVIGSVPEAVLTIVPGAGPDDRDVIRAELNMAPGGRVDASYRIMDSSGWWSPATPLSFEFPLLRTAEDPTGSLPGVAAAYYALNNPSVLPDFPTLVPYLSSSVTSLNFASTGGNFANSGRAENVGALFTGWIDIPQSGEWRLFTNSDDGSKLWIGDELVVNNDGLHAMVEVGGTIGLARGRHRISVGFFERGGGAGLIVSWEGPGTPKQAVPASRWTRGGTLNWADVNRDGSVNALDISGILAAWGSLAGGTADANRDGRVDGSDLAVVLAGWGG